MKSEVRLVADILETPALCVLADQVAKRGEAPILSLRFPEPEELRKEAYRWAHTLFAACEDGDARPEPIEHGNRLVLRHPDGFRVRAYGASGYLEYRHLTRAFAGSTDVTDLGTGHAIASEFGARHQLWPLDSQEQLRPEAIRYIKSQGATLQSDTCPVITNNAIVIYQRISDGIPWIGPGSKVAALIEGREVVGFDRHWRRVIPAPGKVVRLASIERAVETLVRTHALRSAGSSVEAKDIHIARVEFGYYAAAKRVLQRSLHPVFAFFHHAAGDHPTAGFVDIVPAHGERFESAWRPPATPIAQRKRRGSTAVPRAHT